MRGILRSVAMTVCVASGCGGSTAASGAGARAQPAAAPLEGDRVLRLVVERAAAVNVAAEQHHLRLLLGADGRYQLREWEDGSWQRESTGPFRRDAGTLILENAEPGVNLTFAMQQRGDELSLCLSASEERETPAAELPRALLGAHAMVETLSGARAVEQPMRVRITFGPKDAVAVHTLDGTATLEGTLRADADLVHLTSAAPDGPRVTLAYWFTDDRLVLCRDLYRGGPASTPSS